jgi:hypothetical protein
VGLVRGERDSVGAEDANRLTKPTPARVAAVALRTGRAHPRGSTSEPRSLCRRESPRRTSAPTGQPARAGAQVVIDVNTGESVFTQRVSRIASRRGW